MNNAEYVKSLGLEFKDLTAKIEDYSEADKVYTWGVLNKKTNKRIGSYRSFDKKDFPVVPVIIGEWLLQEDAYDKINEFVNKYMNKDSKVVLRNGLTLIVMAFVYDVGDNVAIDRQVYIDKVNKLVGRDICDTSHIVNLDGEGVGIYVEWLGKTYLLGSVDISTDYNSMKKTIYYDRIEAFVNAYPEDTVNE